MRSVAAAAVALLLVVFVARRAAAVEYELPVEIETEDDLYELHEAGEISDETFDTLVELLRKGVDLNTADEDEIYALPGLTLAEAQAVVTYRTAAGGIPDPGGLVAGGVLGADKLLAIAPFLIVSQPKTPSF